MMCHSLPFKELCLFEGPETLDVLPSSLWNVPPTKGLGLPNDIINSLN